MEIGESRLGSLLVLRPVGRIDNATSAAFQTRLLAAEAAGAVDVVIDFAGVEYISSAGLRALMAASKLKAKDHRLAVVGLNQVVREIFTISRFSHVVPIYATVEAASEAWAAAPQSSDIPARIDGKPDSIKLHFWGTRGSLPAPLNAAVVRAKLREALVASRERSLDSTAAIEGFIDEVLPFSTRGTYGGNTSCVQIATGEQDYVVCDMGTGLREFGARVLAEHGAAHKNRFHIFLSHLHWDHIMGFPFFGPAYIPGNVIRLIGCHEQLREALEGQHRHPYFPVDFKQLGATIEFVHIEPGQTYEIGGLSVVAMKQFHAGDSYAFRFSRGGKSLVYSTDCEHKYPLLDETYPFIDFYRDVDVLIFDSMYSLADTVSIKEDWGHSNNIVAVELAQMARAKRLVLFHHEPAYDDRMIERVLGETIRFEEISRGEHQVEVMSAWDGLELVI